MTTIRKIDNGYVVSNRDHREVFYPNAQELFDGLLLDLEGRSKHFGGSSYGRAFVADSPTQSLTENPQ